MEKAAKDFELHKDLLKGQLEEVTLNTIPNVTHFMGKKYIKKIGEGASYVSNTTDFASDSIKKNEERLNLQKQEERELYLDYMTHCKGSGILRAATNNEYYTYGKIKEKVYNELHLKKALKKDKIDPDSEQYKSEILAYHKFKKFKKKFKNGKELKEKDFQYKQYIDELKNINESSYTFDVIYKPNLSGNTKLGSISFNNRTKNIELIAAQGSMMNNVSEAVIAHEMKHASQFLMGQLSITTE